MKSKISFFLILWAMVVNAQEKSNIIFVLTDDQQCGLLGCEGNPIVKTPNIDKLADDGVRFSNAHVTSAICTPSRVSILLGQFERKHGVNFNSGTSVSPEAWDKSYPVVMRNNGYYTGYIGKNHSPIGDGGYQSGLMEKSFDYWYAGHGHLSFYPKKRHKIFKSAKHDTQVEIINEGVDDFFSNEHRMEGALHFIDQRPKDKPFCLSICFNLPHGASTGSMKQLATDSVIYRDLYRDLEIPMPENYVAKADIKEPKLPVEIHRAYDRQAGYNYVDNPKDNRERLIRQMQAMTGIDGLFGNLRKTLKEKGLDKNTIIIYTSDHGLFMGQQGLGGKALCYEETTHVPMIVYNPMDKKKVRGRVCDELVQTIDITSTMISYAGIVEPKEFQGKDLSALISGKQEKVRDYLFTENLWSTQFGNPRCESIQNKEWKYIRYYKNENLSASVKIAIAKDLGVNINKMLYSVHDPDIALYRTFVEGPLNGEKPVYEELYNLKDDPHELNNLVHNKKHSEILNTLREEWKVAIKEARGSGKPKVLRYTADSMMEKYGYVKNE
ncbi:sulfatase-like hydrolase/transferase [Saccharicrinis fermentans]|uniref:Arylsulfatase n=1 Tax=Saccharicrinis fermentans DSM 9555 = JCM 21142 TaxID=869213 RepID=W7YLU2_9BACT|nr:sulfatase-like hydrolase/transferase [Saccharicrinis fermentans]GAF05581.1 arylsulfatase [Saccharicrinis fermentans DSM 9555 = JCM 21142]